MNVTFAQSPMAFCHWGGRIIYIKCDAAAFGRRFSLWKHFNCFIFTKGGQTTQCDQLKTLYEDCSLLNHPILLFHSHVPQGEGNGSLLSARTKCTAPVFPCFITQTHTHTYSVCPSKTILLPLLLLLAVNWGRSWTRRAVAASCCHGRVASTSAAASAAARPSRSSSTPSARAATATTTSARPAGCTTSGTEPGSAPPARRAGKVGPLVAATAAWGSTGGVCVRVHVCSKLRLCGRQWRQRLLKS